MKKKIMAVLSVVLIALIGSVWYGFHMRTERKTALQQEMLHITQNEVTLNQIVPFAWDTVYTFGPYIPKEEIEAVIGFRSHAIEEGYSDGVRRLIFVNGKQLAAMVRGFPSDLGYDILFDDKITYEENAVFSVSRENGIIQLTVK